MEGQLSVLSSANGRTWQNSSKVIRSRRIIVRLLSIVGGYVEPEELYNLLKDRPFDFNCRDDILIFVLTFRLAATACFWPLVHHLVSQVKDQAKYRNIEKGGNDGTHVQLDEREWGRRLLDFQLKDARCTGGWDAPRQPRERCSMRHAQWGTTLQ